MKPIDWSELPEKSQPITYSMSRLRSEHTITTQPLKDVIGGAVFPGGLNDAGACQHIFHQRQIEW